jgi:mono/diheme cytochrome c family protein
MKMQKIITSSIVIYFLMFSCQQHGNTNTETLSKEESSKKLFIDNCVVCHGEDGKRQMANASDLSISKLQKKELKEVISNGRKSMPPYKSVFNDEELELLLEYIENEIKK